MLVTEQYLRKLASSALYLPERRRGDVRLQEDARSEERLALWRSKVGSERFQRRLDSEGLREEEAVALCGNAAFAGEKLPAWTDTLREVLGGVQTPMPEVRELIGRDTQDSMYAVFVGNCFAPFLLYGRRRLLAECGDLSATIVENLCTELYYRLCALGFNTIHYHTLTLSGETERLPTPPCEVLSKGGYLGMFQEYPVLARVLCECTETWLRVSGELLKRIGGVTGRGSLSRIGPGISDLHAGGRCVHILEWEDGEKLVYKPRCLRIDAAWADFCRKLGESTGVLLRSAPVTDCGTHGFCSFIEHMPLSEGENAGAFFENAGRLLCALFLLGATDIHAENVIANGADLYVVDNETITRSFRNPMDALRQTSMLHTVIKTKIHDLSLLLDDSAPPEELEFGGLYGGGSRFKNMPGVGGNLHIRNFLPEVCAGFSDTYDRILAADPEPLRACFRGVGVRHLLRPTMTYVKMRNLVNSRQFHRDGFLYSCELERLSPSLLGEGFPIYRSERDALLRGDIPVFYQRPGSKALYDDKDFLVDGFFSDNLDGGVLFAGMGEEDKQLQLEIIRDSAVSNHTGGKEEDG